MTNPRAHSDPDDHIPAAGRVRPRPVHRGRTPRMRSTGLPWWLSKIGSAVPFVLVLLAVVAAVWGYTAVSLAFPDTSFIQRFYSTISMFAGNYVALRTDQTVPSPRIAFPASLAFLVTIVAAGAIIVQITARARNAMRAYFARPELVVIGSGPTAAAIVRSCHHERIHALLVCESPYAPSRRAAGKTTPVVIVPSLTVALEHGIARRASGRCDNVVIATESDTENLQLQRTVVLLSHPKASYEPVSSDSACNGSVATGGTTAPRNDSLDRVVSRPGPTPPAGSVSRAATGLHSAIAVVRDPRLAEAMKAKTLTHLPAQYVTCPAENIAEHFGHVIDAVATGPLAVGKTSGSALARGNVDLVHVEPRLIGPPTPMTDTIELWMRRIARGRTFLNGKWIESEQACNPLVPLEFGRANPEDERSALTIRFYIGENEGDVVVEVLGDVRRGVGLPDVMIVAAEASLLAVGLRTLTNHPVISGEEWLDSLRFTGGDDGRLPIILAVTPDSVGLDARLVVDDVKLQWARAFNQTYRFMFAEDHVIDGWRPGQPLGSRTKMAERAALRDPDRPCRVPDSDIVTSVRKSISDKHSSEIAAQNMFVNLTALGFTIERYDDARPGTPPPPVPGRLRDPDVVDTIARWEHDNWLVRSWEDTSRRRRFDRNRNIHFCRDYSSSGITESFDQMLGSSEPRHRKAVQYNRRIVTETYPALAAGFGYRICDPCSDDS